MNRDAFELLRAANPLPQDPPALPLLTLLRRKGGHDGFVHRIDGADESGNRPGRDDSGAGERTRACAADGGTN
jgi:hypothetical protein